jgi:hypothetical protein
MIISTVILNLNFSFSIELLIIFLLFIYVIYLHLQLVKKNSLLKTFYEKVEKQGSKLEKKDIISFLGDVKKSDDQEIITRDKLFDNKVRNFLFENDKKTKLFLHYTPRQDIANKILKEGFKFVNSFYKTAEYIYNDDLYLVHRHHEHKQYGNYVIVICISRDTYDYFSNKLGKLRAKNISVEQILTKTPSYKDENSDDIYTCPKQFIKGYFNYTNGTITANPEFNLSYRSKIFDENIEKLTLIKK